MDESSAGSASTGSSSNATTGASNLLLTKGFQIRRRAFVNQFLRKRLRVKDANDAKASFAQRPSGGAKGQAAASSRATSRRPAPLAAPRIGCTPRAPAAPSENGRACAAPTLAETAPPTAAEPPRATPGCRPRPPLGGPLGRRGRGPCDRRRRAGGHDSRARYGDQKPIVTDRR